MSTVAEELRRARREIVRLNRKMALQRIPGKVVERDPKTRKVRLDLGQDPESGTVAKSPWVRVQSGSAGRLKAFTLPSIGEQMYLESASGVIGADSLATFGAFDDDNPFPEQEADESVLGQVGKTRLSLVDGELRMAVGGVTHTLTKDGPVFKGGKITHDGRSIGSDHVHPGIYRGGAKTDPPD
jgi:hypothetical protein